jgi:hypothetical protein
VAIGRKVALFLDETTVFVPWNSHFDRVRQDVCRRARPIDSDVFYCFAARRQGSVAGTMQLVLQESLPITAPRQDHGRVREGSD